jgi:general secretion pathway protein L
MSEYLLIHYIPGQQDNLQHWALGGDQHPSITLGHGKLDELAAIARGKTVTVLIDSHYTTLKAVSVPSKNRSKQLLAIPFAMEDSLAEDIEDTHFALGKVLANSDDKNNQLPVIAINRELLRTTLTLFDEQGIHVNHMTADALLLPAESNTWSILLDEANAVIKCGDAELHNCEVENLQVILAALLEQADKPPESISCYHKADSQDVSKLFENTDILFTEKTYQNHPLEIYLGSFKENQSINILQGEFTAKRETSITWLQPWKYVAAIAGIWLVLHLAYASILTDQLEDKNIALAKKIEMEFKRAIPDAKKMTNMQKRVERRLKDLKSTGSTDNRDGFLSILSEATPALSANKNINIKAAIYRNNYIDIDLSAASLEDVEQVKTKLLESNKIKTVLSTTIEKDKVKGRLRLEAKG